MYEDEVNKRYMKLNYTCKTHEHNEASQKGWHFADDILKGFFCK